MVIVVVRISCGCLVGDSRIMLEQAGVREQTTMIYNTSRHSLSDDLQVIRAPNLGICILNLLMLCVVSLSHFYE